MIRPIEILSKQPTTYTESDENAYLHSHIIDAMYEYARLCCEEQKKSIQSKMKVAWDKEAEGNYYDCGWQGPSFNAINNSILNCPNVVDNE